MMRVPVISRSLVVVAMLATTFSRPGPVTAAAVTVTDIPNPDAYTCGQSGSIDFEQFPDGTNLASVDIPGVRFSTRPGYYAWLVGDFATGQYLGKYPNGPYTSQGTHWAWLPNVGWGRIEFVDGPASIVSVLVSNDPGDYNELFLYAYGADNAFLVSAGPPTLNFDTGHMTELKITRDTADIAYVVIADGGFYTPHRYLVDSVCTNAPGVPRSSLQIQIDIKPGSDPAPINLRSQGRLPVAILSGPAFDATSIRLDTVTLGPNNAPALDKGASIQDVNHDGRPDVILHFDNAKIGIGQGDMQLCLAGQTTSGLAVTGCDAIVTVPPS
jgi:hypothetical protein